MPGPGIICPCGVFVPHRFYDGHVRSRAHQQRLEARLTGLPYANPSIRQPFQPNIPPVHPPHQDASPPKENFLNEYQLNKRGISVSNLEGIDFDIVESNATQSMVITIKNDSRGERIKLNQTKLSSSYQVATNARGDHFSLTILGESDWIESGSSKSIVVMFHPLYAGVYKDTLELTFHNKRKKKGNIQFAITRPLRAVFGSKDDHEVLKPKEDYIKPEYVPLEAIFNIIPPERPPTWTPTRWAKKLLEYKYSEELIGLAHEGHRAVMRSRYMPAPFNVNTHGQRFQTMLWIEEERCKRDLDLYAMSDVQLKAKYPRYSLEVAGLAEGRPSVLVGDHMYVKHHDEGEEGQWFEGRVHEVLANSVTLRFAESFSMYRGTKFDVRFVLNRIPFRRMHQAVTTKSLSNRLLFPDRTHMIRRSRPTQEQMGSVRCFDRKIGEDSEQLEAVTAILNLPPGSPPFVVFGPPGTGKTVTIIEAMRQVLDNNPDARILACAPSNSAADHIAVGLVPLGRMQLFRLNAISRKYRDLPETLDPFSLINDNDVFAIPSCEELAKFRVVVSTCISGGIPFSLGLRRGHFTHIFIDEAGQAMEPEVLVPINTMSGYTTNVVLAGDHQQLGPIVRSTIAQKLGLKESYLARMMARQIYDLQGTNPDGIVGEGKGIVVVKLLKHWRSHPSIIAFSNDSFYDGELVPCGDRMITHSLSRSSVLVKEGFPVVFHGIVGKDQREMGSPSFFNINEATEVKKYCMDLTSDRKLRIRPEDIGIITPYHAQRHKIVRTLPEGLRKIKVGSVEEFQGQERRVIIISTVRSSTEYLQYDVKHTLGFVANPRRFNVAITRAQALLVVIGNPIVLSMDPVWRSFMNFIHIHGGWRGKDIEWNPEETVRPEGGYDAEIRKRAQVEAEEMVTRLRTFVLETGEELVDDGGEEDYVDQPWREPE